MIAGFHDLSTMALREERKRLRAAIGAIDDELRSRRDPNMCVCATGKSVCAVHGTTTPAERTANAAKHGWPSDYEGLKP